jgi:trigger factor
LASLRGTVYEEKIITAIKTKAKPNKKEINKDEAEKILKEHQKHEHNHEHDHPVEKKANTKTKAKVSTARKSSTAATKVKKVSKK